MSGGSFDFAGREIGFEQGDSVLVALTRTGVHPTGGGTLCFGGDCPNCLCTVDGVSYVRACQTTASDGQRIEPHPDGAAPELPSFEHDAADDERPVVHYLTTDVIVIGGGPAGQTATTEALDAGRRVEVFDASAGAEVLGIYPGPMVVVRSAGEIIRAECDRVVVATGAAEIQPIVPGSDLAGIYTRHGADVLARSGVDLGHVATVTPETLARFEAGQGDEAGRVVAVIGPDGSRTPCDNAIVDLGRTPRSSLARMADPDEVTVVGDAADVEETVPICPTSGVICPCSNVTIAQLDDLYARGFTHIELLKRGSLAGTGTCQGGVCTPYLRSFLADRGEELQPAFTARPLARQATLGELAAGAHLPAAARTALDGVHRDLGAEMERLGGWWRPWTYGDTEAEYRAVRERVSIGDVSTLGKMILTGPDAEDALQRLFPTDVSTIRPGRSRYVLMLDERGFVLDDGLIAREHDGTFFLTFTSGGASMSEMWIRDWTASWGHDIRVLNRTWSMGAINVTGPRAAALLGRLGVADLPSFMGHGVTEVAGITCKVFRLGFTGELSFELHHDADRSVDLWDALVEAGGEFGLLPHGIDALFRLRLEKGHILVGQDTDYDSTPHRIQHGWAVNLKKPHQFIGRHAVERTARIPVNRKLVGFEADQPFPFEGATAWSGDEYAGYLTSVAWSPVLDKAIALGWLERLGDDFPDQVTVEGVDARVVPPHFYDPEGLRARA